MNIFDRFTDSTKRLIAIAAKVASDFGHGYVGSEHILMAMCNPNDSLGKLLESKGVTGESVGKKIHEMIGISSYNNGGALEYTPRTKKILEGSFEQASIMGQEYVAPEHLLLSILDEGESVAVAILIELGVDIEKLYDEIDRQDERSRAGGSATPTLEKYGVDLTESAKNDKLDPVIGRDTEIERVIQILSRRTKNNPVLIGEPGVGKSAIAEGLAQKLYKDDVPEILKNRRIVMLDLAGMIAGAKYRGEFEDRLKSALKEVQDNKDIILFIDEIHTLIGTGASEGAMDAANILKPSLARGEIQLIGATTLNEYKKNIEKDAALERRFAPVTVGEPTKEEAFLILKGLRDKYEAHHKVKITDSAIEAAVNLSARYISDRFLPDKAIDLMDEAASKVRINSTITPPDIKELESQVEKEIMEKNFQHLYKKLNITNMEKKAAIDSQDYESAAKHRDRERELSAKLEELQRDRKSKENGDVLEVTDENIASIVSQWTKIPVSDITEDEGKKLLNLEDTLHKSVIGQNEAVKAISRAIRRARAGLKNPNRPIGSFIFLGPTGVGKTELSKALAKAMFGDENAMVRIDMTEYMEKHAVSKMIGSPPGYVGFEEGGQLTEAVRRRPYSVLLLDEIEKAHPDVFNILLQILDDGRLTDSQGRTVDFKNTVIIMTSNIGSQDIKSKTMGFGAGNDTVKEYEDIKKKMIDSLKKAFRPEFINRLDDTIVFHKLTQEDIRQIVDIMIEGVAKNLKERDVEITVSDEAKDYLAKKGYDPEYGARPLRRTIQQSIEDSLSELILDGKLKLGQKVNIGFRDENLTFDVE